MQEDLIPTLKSVILFEIKDAYLLLNSQMQNTTNHPETTETTLSIYKSGSNAQNA
jgi:hypothetical protein